MDTTPVRDLPGPALSRPTPVVTTARAGRRWVLPVAALLVVLQLGLRTWLVAQRDFFADDFRLLALADRSTLLSPSYLFQDFDGHLMPGAFLVAGLVERAAPLEWWPAALSLVVLQALASATLLRVLWVLLGDRPVLLVPLAFGLFTPITLGVVTWWAAALNSIPLQIGLAWYVAAAVRLAQTGRRRHAVSGTLALAFALAFYLKAVLLPPVALAVVAVVLVRDGARDPLRAAVRRARALWVGTAAVAAGWAVTYLSTRRDAPVGDGSTGEVVATVGSGFEALAPAVLGGPFRWVIFPPAMPMSAPGGWAVALSVMVLLAAIVSTCVRRQGALAVWLLAGAVVGAGLLLAALGRSGLGLGDVAPLAYRYFAGEAVLLPIAGALLVSLPLRRGPDRYARPRPWAAPAAVAATTVLTVAFVATCVSSTVDHARAWDGDRTGEYLATARTSLAAAAPAPLLDQTVPVDVMWELSYPANLTSQVFGPLPDRPPFAPWTSDLRALDGAGELRPAQVVPELGLAPGPVTGCGWVVAGGQAAAVPLTGSAGQREWTVELGYIAGRDGSIEVALGDGQPVDAEVAQGVGTVYVRLIGGGSDLRVAPRTPGLGLCLGNGAVGTVAVG